MDLAAIKAGIVTNVYHLTPARNVPLHQHAKHDEIFYCLAGTGVGILADQQIPLQPGQTFIVPASTMHTVRTDSDLYVASFLVPISDASTPTPAPSAT
jgi:oxalate decarboxylase/phosphoglucose isomerase-like protein (cupin superfamily)